MSSISQKQRYLPHELNTKFHAVKLYRNGVTSIVTQHNIKKNNSKTY